MKHVLRVLSAVLVAGGVMATPAGAQELKVGDQAPDFTLPGTDGKTYAAAQLRGHWVVLAWFPKAFTAG